MLSQNEITRLINGTQELRYQTYILVCYSMGLRLTEALNLMIKDIDSEHNRVHIRQGKGRKDRKDRYVTMPNRTLLAMRLFWRTHRHKKFIFPAGRSVEEQHTAVKTMPSAGLQKAIKAVAQSCNIHKNITVHTLRHSYATHLLETGLNLRSLQYLLGHQSLNTTAAYTRITPEVEQNTSQMVNLLTDRLDINLGV